MVSATSPLTHALLREYHDSPLGEHAKELKTYLRLADEWYWMGMGKAVARHIHACTVCQGKRP